LYLIGNLFSYRQFCQKVNFVLIYGTKKLSCMILKKTFRKKVAILRNLFGRRLRTLGLEWPSQKPWCSASPSTIRPAMYWEHLVRMFFRKKTPIKLKNQNFLKKKHLFILIKFVSIKIIIPYHHIFNYIKYILLKVN
jgi:hypothetical protein